MIQLLLDGKYDGVDLYFVRMGFSRDLDSSGKWKASKLLELVKVLWGIVYKKIRWNPDAIYYPPSGPRLFPILRDMFLLCPTRWLFRSTIFHFHASGLTEYKPRLNLALRKAFDIAFDRPDIAIRLSQNAPPEGPNLRCEREYIIPNGIPDSAGSAITRANLAHRPIRILFVGLLTEGKGVLVAIEAVQKLLVSGMNLQLVCMGKWESPEVMEKAKALIQPSFEDRFTFPGVLTGDSKWAHYRDADIFCFPSFFHSETFPLVLLEAMCFSLPIVCTSWRGIPDVVDEGSNAIIVQPRSIDECADGLALLIGDPNLRESMGRKSRERFVRFFTVDAYREAMQTAFLSLRERNV
jgi:glycosyltransferase involved in cell wall biosynthesis